MKRRFLILSLMPFLYLLLGIHLLLWTAKLWVPLEYRMPGFPEDRYGFTYADRVQWSEVDITYLVSGKSIDFFDDYHLDTGESMHNPSELRHMEDVKELIDASRIALAVLAVIVLIPLSTFGLNRRWRDLGEMLMDGGRLTIALMIALGIGIALSFNFIFVGFHHIFFEGDTWLFAYSDTFIRLYPERFWLDTFVYVVLLTLFQASFSWILGRRMVRRQSSE